MRKFLDTMCSFNGIKISITEFSTVLSYLFEMHHRTQKNTKAMTKANAHLIVEHAWTILSAHGKSMSETPESRESSD